MPGTADTAAPDEQQIRVESIVKGDMAGVEVSRRMRLLCRSVSPHAAAWLSDRQRGCGENLHQDREFKMSAHA